MDGGNQKARGLGCFPAVRRTCNARSLHFNVQSWSKLSSSACGPMRVSHVGDG